MSRMVGLTTVSNNGKGKAESPGVIDDAKKPPNGENATARPRPPALWSVYDVVKWLERHCGELGGKYSDLFRKHNVSGRTFILMNPPALERMGITNPAHRESIVREIVKLKLKSDILELRELESQLP